MSCGRMLFAEVESVLESRSLNSRSPGRLPKWPTGADCKSAGLRLRWFESITYHHPIFQRRNSGSGQWGGTARLRELKLLAFSPPRKAASAYRGRTATKMELHSR